MKVRMGNCLCAAFCLLVVVQTASAQQQLTPADLVRQGDYVWLNNQGNPGLALPYYNQAYPLALNRAEAPVLTILAERYLLLGQDNAAVTCYAAAIGAAERWMRSDPLRGQNYRYGFDALNHLITNWNTVLNPLWFGKPVDPVFNTPAQPPRLSNVATRNALLGWAQYASNTVVAASQPAPVPLQPGQPRVRGPGGNPADNCDRSVPNSCDVILTPRNPR